MIVLGIVGTESTHVPRFLEMLNDRTIQPGVRVGALWGHDNSRTGALAARYGVDSVVAEPERMLGCVDAVIVADRDGGDHRRHAMPFLVAGLPVYVNKPLSRTVLDAQAMISAAEQHGALLTSFTPLRWLPEIEELQGVGQPRLVVATGPADPDSPHGGVSFYGVHAVEIALHLAGGSLVGSVVRRLSPTMMMVTGSTEHGVAVAIALLRPTVEGAVPFHAQVVTTTGVQARTLRAAPGYLALSLERFVTMIRTGRPALSHCELLAPVQVIAAVEATCHRAPESC